MDVVLRLYHDVVGLQEVTEDNLEMCIRDRRETWLAVAKISKRTFFPLKSKSIKSFPVSYTHLDVYKRQVAGP